MRDRKTNQLGMQKMSCKEDLGEPYNVSLKVQKLVIAAVLGPNQVML